VLLSGLLGLLVLNFCVTLKYGKLVGSELLCSPAGGLTFLFRQESKQRTDQRRGAEVFPFGTLYALVPFSLGNKPPSPLDSNGIKLAERNFPTQGEAGFIDITRKILRKFAKNA
jgi:hypothetical protein